MFAMGHNNDEPHFFRSMRLSLWGRGFAVVRRASITYTVQLAALVDFLAASPFAAWWCWWPSHFRLLD